MYIQETPLVHRSGSWSDVGPSLPGWEYVRFDLRRLRAGESIALDGAAAEWGVVPLAGTARIDCDGVSTIAGGRASVFDARGDCFYVPAGCQASVHAETDLEVALCGAAAAADGHREPALVVGASREVELRGSGNASRQVHTLIGPSFPADRLHVVEVWTPGGNWSSYPPHKHDEEGAGETVLDETYYFRTRAPQGFALQRLYSEPRQLDLTMVVRDGDLLRIPFGFHTTCAGHGFDLYYLNVLAGPQPERSLTAREDPDFTGIRDAWAESAMDPRLPLVS
jgi:5-deoxy-glucuronate isomerase